MNRDQKINLFITAFLIGVALMSQILADSLFFYLAILLLILLIWWVGHAKISRHWQYFSFILMILGMLLGGMRIWLDGNLDKSWREAKLYQQKVWIEGEIVVEPVVKEGQQSFYLKIISLEQTDQKIPMLQVDRPIVRNPVGLLVRIKLPVFPELHWRYQVILEGVLLKPENSEGFNYADFLMKDRVYWLLDKPHLKKVVERKEFNWLDLNDYLYQLRNLFLLKTYNIFIEPAGGIMAGVLIGERSNISAGILKNFQITGLTHILAISGFNISLIINIISFLVARQGKWTRFLVILALIIIFVIITGASASVIRAAVMGGMVLTIKTLGKSSQILKIILLSGFLMVMVNPRILNFDISFQLSFFATMSLILYSEKINKWWEFEDKDQWKASKIEKVIMSLKNFAKESVLTTIAAQIITLPIIFYNFGTISLISPIANLLIGPFIPWIMLFGFFAVVMAFGSAFLGLIGTALASFIISLMLIIVDLLARLPLASITLGKGQIWLAVLYYLMIFRFFHKHKQGRDLS